MRPIVSCTVCLLATQAHGCRPTTISTKYSANKPRAEHTSASNLQVRTLPWTVYIVWRGEERRSQECDVCTRHRRMRCRILGSSDLSPDIKEPGFDDAPYNHQWNAPKYNASQLRARHYAQRTRRILLWVVAEDTPLHKDHTTCTVEALQAKKIQWLLRHDQETGGIVGLRPLVKGMPLRVTTTQARLK